ncbi:MAG TPA: carboxypeptidase-like regulatory domain-containing protein, partial [Gammaproteobacteria bacterium]|nr:carboxypeptidase-like regulatory domain-containing protein [Gammaproteobacteria bacterium]
LLLSACGTLGTPIPPTETPIPSAATPIPPTDTPKPSPWIEGFLINKETNQPLGNARLVLCQQQDESTCIVKVNLTALTNADGQFKITDVPNGKYAMLYNASGNSFQPDLNNKILYYSPKTTSADPGVGNVNHLMKSLGVSTVSLCNAFCEVVNGNLVISGYVYAESTDIGFIFVGGDMIYVTIDDSPAKLDLRVWDAQNKDKCEGGEFKPLP